MGSNSSGTRTGYVNNAIIESAARAAMMSTSALILPVGNAAAAAAANGSGGSVDSTDALAATGYINGEMVSKTLAAAAAAAAAKREEEEKDKANGNGAGRYSTDAVSDFDSDSDDDASGLKDYTADIYELRPGHGHQGNATATPAAATVGERSANHGEIRRSEADRRLKLATPNRYRFLVRFKRKSPSFDGLSFIVSYSLDGLTRPQHVLITQPTRGT